MKYVPGGVGTEQSGIAVMEKSNEERNGRSAAIPEFRLM
jgi:hypothetical protein